MSSSEYIQPPVEEIQGPRRRDPRLSGIADVRRHVARGMLTNSAYQVLLVGLAAIRGLGVAAFVTRTDYGIWGLLGLSLWTAAGLKAQFGAGEKYLQQADEDQELAFHRAFTVDLIFMLAMIPVGVGAVAAFAAITGKSVVIVPGLVLLLLLPAGVLQFPITIFYRQLDYRRQRILQGVEPVVATAVTISLAIAGAGYWSFVIGALAGAWAGVPLALRFSPYRLALRYERHTLGQYVGFSTPLLLTGIAVLAMFYVINLVGIVPLGLAGLGAFTLVGNLVQFTDQADDIVTATLYPAVCAVRDRVDLMTEIFVKSNRLSLMWAVPFGVAVTLFAADLARFVLGPRWLPGVPLLEIMGIVTAVHHVGYNWGAFLKARGTTWPIAVAAVVIAGTVIAASIPLMYSHGLVGLGVAFAIGELVAFLIRGYFVARFFDARILVQLGRAFAPSLLAGAVVLACRLALGHEQDLAAALAVLGIYCAVTVAATAILERPLVSEAAGYLLRGSGQGAVSAEAALGPPAVS